MMKTINTPLSVSQLNRQIKYYLENEIGEINVQGEISNLSRPSSGHYYFTLKDASAQIRCVFFKNRHFNHDLKALTEGLEITAQGHLSLYEARGDYQLIIEQWTKAGLGELYRQFEALKEKLETLGLFAPERKKNLPRFPESIGVITSPSGAAIRDILTTLARRFPVAKVKIYPSEVQGLAAPLQLIQAVKQAEKDNQCDVLILARGGGSLEDLWAFNDEQLALTLAACPIPIVSGVGHETDFTIADFVADKRAATPTAAAEAVTPDATELLVLIRHFSDRIAQGLYKTLHQSQMTLKYLIERLSSPQKAIASHWQTLDYREKSLYVLMDQSLRRKDQTIQSLRARLNQQNPLLLIHQASNRCKDLTQRMVNSQNITIQRSMQKLHRLLATLNAVSPLATLDRGYALATQNKKVLSDAFQVKPGEHIQVRLAKGYLLCEVESVHD